MRRSFLKYLLVQIPGWLLTAAVAWLLWKYVGLPLWAAIAAIAISVGKDFVMYPLVRRAYDADGRNAAEDLIGQIAVAKQPLNPTGYVQVRGQLWQARTADGEPAIEEGGLVRVREVKGMTLIVSRGNRV